MVRYLPWVDDKEFHNNYIVLTASNRENSMAMKQQLQTEGITCLYADAVHVALMYSRIKSVAEMLDDDLSKLSYWGVMYYFLTFDNHYIQTIDNQYFAIKPFIKPTNEVVVDCGAYVGDTVEEYVKRSSSDVSRRTALITRVQRLQNEYAWDEDVINVIPTAVGEKSGKASLNVSGNEMVLAENGEEIEVVSLSEFFIDKQKPTLIKADIEGMEMPMLKGARKLLCQSAKYDNGGGSLGSVGVQESPIKLAVCIYHSTAEFYTIPEYVHSLNPNYHLCIRTHSAGFQETVLYAY